MSLWLEIARLAAGLNVVLLLGLGYVWAGNYRQFRSKHTLGLLVFGVFLLAENLLWVYTYTMSPVLQGWLYSSGTTAQQAMMGLCVLESGGLAFLAWITWD